VRPEFPLPVFRKARGSLRPRELLG